MRFALLAPARSLFSVSDTSPCEPRLKIESYFGGPHPRPTNYFSGGTRRKSWNMGLSLISGVLPCVVGAPAATEAVPRSGIP